MLHLRAENLLACLRNVQNARRFLNCPPKCCARPAARCAAENAAKYSMPWRAWRRSRARSRPAKFFDLETRADSILQSPAPCRRRGAAAAARTLRPPASKSRGCRFWNGATANPAQAPLHRPMIQRGSGSADTSMEFTLPPGELDRIFVESKNGSAPPLATEARRDRGLQCLGAGCTGLRDDGVTGADAARRRRAASKFRKMSAATCSRSWSHLRRPESASEAIERPARRVRRRTRGSAAPPLRPSAARTRCAHVHVLAVGGACCGAAADRAGRAPKSRVAGSHAPLGGVLRALYSSWARRCRSPPIYPPISSGNGA